MVHEQKLKDLQSSTCQISVERIVLDLKSEAAWGNILSLDFFHVVKPLMSILSLLSMLSIYEKLEWKHCGLSALMNMNEQVHNLIL